MNPKHKIGQVVQVYEYLADETISGMYHGLIVDIDCHRLALHGNPRALYIYHVLPNELSNDRRGIQTAEEFAIEPLENQ